MRKIKGMSKKQSWRWGKPETVKTKRERLKKSYLEATKAKRIKEDKERRLKKRLEN